LRGSDEVICWNVDKKLERMPASPQNASLRLRPQSGANGLGFFVQLVSAPDSFPSRGSLLGILSFNVLDMKQYYNQILLCAMFILNF